MKKVTLVCDDCGLSSDEGMPVRSYEINNGKEMDPSGNGYNIDWVYVDYCDDCLRTWELKNPYKEIRLSR